MTKPTRIKFSNAIRVKWGDRAACSTAQSLIPHTKGHLAVPGAAQVTMAGMDNLIGCGGNDLMLLSNMLDDTKLSEEKAEQERVRHLGPGDIGPPKQASPDQRLTPEAGRTLYLGNLLEGGAATGKIGSSEGIPTNCAT
jgi:hypothetical protein